jgi:hypothetical protein
MITDRSEYFGWTIAGALEHLGYRVSDQTVGNILRRFGIPPAPNRRQHTSWMDFIRSHMAVLNAPACSRPSRFRSVSPVIAKPILCGLHHEYRWADAA